MIKRTVAVILSGILIVGMVGCTNKTEEANDATQEKKLLNYIMKY